MIGYIKKWLLNIVRRLPDDVYLKIKYFHIFKCRLHLRKPVTFNEKLQYLKLYNRKPEYTTMVDKYAVKSYVEKILGGGIQFL